MKPITVFMTEEEARQFLLFQKYHDVFCILESQKAFELAFGKITLNIAFNAVQNIIKEEMFYVKPKES